MNEISDKDLERRMRLKLFADRPKGLDYFRRTLAVEMRRTEGSA